MVWCTVSCPFLRCTCCLQHRMPHVEHWYTRLYPPPHTYACSQLPPVDIGGGEFLPSPADQATQSCLSALLTHSLADNAPTLAPNPTAHTV
jgi:hypothetical protein